MADRIATVKDNIPPRVIEDSVQESSGSVCLQIGDVFCYTLPFYGGTEPGNIRAMLAAPLWSYLWSLGQPDAEGGNDGVGLLMGSVDNTDSASTIIIDGLVEIAASSAAEGRLQVNRRRWIVNQDARSQGPKHSNCLGYYRHRPGFGLYSSYLDKWLGRLFAPGVPRIKALFDVRQRNWGFFVDTDEGTVPCRNVYLFGPNQTDIRNTVKDFEIQLGDQPDELIKPVGALNRFNSSHAAMNEGLNFLRRLNVYRLQSANGTDNLEEDSKDLLERRIDNLDSGFIALSSNSNGRESLLAGPLVFISLWEEEDTVEGTPYEYGIICKDEAARDIYGISIISAGIGIDDHRHGMECVIDSGMYAAGTEREEPCSQVPRDGELGRLYSLVQPDLVFEKSRCDSASDGLLPDSREMIFDLEARAEALERILPTNRNAPHRNAFGDAFEKYCEVSCAGGYDQSAGRKQGGPMEGLLDMRRRLLMEQADDVEESIWTAGRIISTRLELFRKMRA